MIYIKEGDRRPVATTVLSRGSQIVDLTLAISVTFKMREESESHLTVDATAVITDAAAGEVEYRWDIGDTDQPGQYRAEWEVIWNDGTNETFPTLGFDPVLIDGSVEIS
jgi:hypothetical protein